MSRGSWALAALVLVASYCAGQAGAYSSGAPDFACGTMQPGHFGSPQSSTSPFSLTPSSVSVESGQLMLVTLESTTGTDRFMGFMIQARDSDTDQVIGTFFTTDHKYLTCGPGFNNAVTHGDGSQKGKVVLEWEPKSDFQGDIVFKGSFVKDYFTYWTGVTSEKVTVKRETPPPPPTYYLENILSQETYSHVEDLLFNIDKDKYDIMVALGPVSTEDPPWCAFLDAATQCENLEVATLCTKLCTPVLN